MLENWSRPTGHKGPHIYYHEIKRQIEWKEGLISTLKTSYYATVMYPRYTWCCSIMYMHAIYSVNYYILNKFKIYCTCLQNLIFLPLFRTKHSNVVKLPWATVSFSKVVDATDVVYQVSKVSGASYPSCPSPPALPYRILIRRIKSHFQNFRCTLNYRVKSVGNSFNRISILWTIR